MDYLNEIWLMLSVSIGSLVLFGILGIVAVKIVTWVLEKIGLI